MSSSRGSSLASEWRDLLEGRLWVVGHPFNDNDDDDDDDAEMLTLCCMSVRYV